LIIILSAIPFIRVHATRSLFSHASTLTVDGETFELWGFFEDGPTPAFRLQDLAYIFNGTAAQFDIRTPPDARWDAWIVRGAPYTPKSTELSLDFESRHALFGSDGFIYGQGLGGFDSCPMRTFIVGIDGHDEPATTIVLQGIQDPDGMFFELHGLERLLGIYRYWRDWSLTTGAVAPVQPPIHTIDFIETMLRISGHWVDVAHFYSPAIDESVVWPMAFNLTLTGFTDMDASMAPIREWGQQTWWYPVNLRHLENGYMELTIDTTGHPLLPWDRFTGNDTLNDEPPDDIGRFINHRIVFNASQEYVETMSLYIGDAHFTMMRNDWRDFSQTDPRRYTVGAAEGGGIVLNYVLGVNRISFWTEVELRFYRSTTNNERGRLIYRQQLTDTSDRLLFEFIDTTAAPGNVYYYSIYAYQTRHRQHSRIFDAGGASNQIMVDVNEVLGLPPGYIGAEAPPTATEPNTPEIEETPP